MRTITVSLISATAVAVATGILILRQEKKVILERDLRSVAPGERHPARISLEKIRALGY
ncbi:MAG: hypothetical protein ACE5GJ_12815 [Gemmatimonadota bacterium]